MIFVFLCVFGLTLIRLSHGIDCLIYSGYEDSYRICRIFENATISDSYSSIWMPTTDLDICDWDSSQIYLECDYVLDFDSSVTDKRLITLDLEFDGGLLHLDPATDYPWPRFLQYIDLSGSNNLEGTWHNFSSLPDYVYYFDVSEMTNLIGNLNISSLPRDMEYLDYHDTNLYVSYSDLSGIPPNLSEWRAYETNTYSGDNTFDWENLPRQLTLLNINTIGLRGTINLTNIPNNLCVINGDDNDFDALILPSPESGYFQDTLGM